MKGVSRSKKVNWRQEFSKKVKFRTRIKYYDQNDAVDVNFLIKGLSRP